MLKAKVVQKIDAMYYSAIGGLILTTIYTFVLMFIVARTANRVKFMYHKSTMK